MAKNSFFRFKEFTVDQDKCAMKVCTDACVLGAWADVENAENILDIGTGTGLLALMAGQRNTKARIDAVELDPEAFLQASGNVARSPFHSQIKVINTAIQDFNPDKKYDCIITNPPFFQSDLLSPKVQKNQAHHSTSLSFDELLLAIGPLLSEQGRYNVLLPMDEAQVFTKKAMDLGWNLVKKLTLYHDKSKKPFRQIMTFKRNHLSENQTFDEALYIYEGDSKIYSSNFKQLLKDFYLIF